MSNWSLHDETFKICCRKAGWLQCLLRRHEGDAANTNRAVANWWRGLTPWLNSNMVVFAEDGVLTCSDHTMAVIVKTSKFEVKKD